LNTSKGNDVVRYYDITCEGYNALYREEQFKKYEYVIEYHGIRPYDTILDLGCGTGLFLEYLIEKNIGFEKYVCLDPSRGMLSIYTRKFSDSMFQYKCLVLHGYGEHLPLKPKSIGSVYMFTVWDNLIDKEKVLRELKRIIVDKGFIVISILKKKIDDRVSTVFKKYFKIVEFLGCEDKDCFFILMAKNI